MASSNDPTNSRLAGHGRSLTRRAHYRKNNHDQQGGGVMTRPINANKAVIVVGDRETAERPDLAEKAAEQGAVIAEIYSFEHGEAASHHDLAEVEAVVTALSRAI